VILKQFKEIKFVHKKLYLPGVSLDRLESSSIITDSYGVSLLFQFLYSGAALR